MSNATSSFSCLVVAADALLAQQVERFLATAPSLHCLGSYTSLAAAQRQQAQPPAIVVLDEMAFSDQDSAVLDTWLQPPLVILLAHSPSASVPVLPWPVVDIVEKPVEFPRFLKAAQKALEMCSQQHFPLPVSNNNDYLLIKQGKQLLQVIFDEVRYVEALSDYVHIVTGQNKLLVHGTMRAMEQRFPGPLFLRVHRSFIINTKWVQGLEGNTITITHKHIPIGSTYLKRVRQQLSA